MIELTDKEKSAIQSVKNGIDSLLKVDWTLSNFDVPIEKNESYHLMDEFGDYMAGRVIKKTFVDKQVIVTLIDKEGKHRVFLPRFHKPMQSNEVV